MTNEDFMDMYDDYLMHANKYNNSPKYAGNEKEYNRWYYQNVTKAQAQAAATGGARGRERQRQANVRQLARNAFAGLNAETEAARGRRRSALTRNSAANVSNAERRTRYNISERNRRTANSPYNRSNWKLNVPIVSSLMEDYEGRRRRYNAVSSNSAANVSNEERRSRYKTNMRKRKFTAGVNKIKSRGNKIAKQLKNQWNSHLDNYNIGMDELSNMIKRAKTSRKKKKVRKMAGF